MKSIEGKKILLIEFLGKCKAYVNLKDCIQDKQIISTFHKKKSQNNQGMYFLLTMSYFSQ